MTAMLWVLIVMLAFVLFAMFGFAVQRDVPTFMQTKQAVTIRSLGVTALGLLAAISAVAIAGAVIG